MAAPGYGSPGWLWDCGYGGPWLWRPLVMAGRQRHSIMYSCPVVVYGDFNVHVEQIALKDNLTICAI